jgi:uncharacterized heparinase superfamily protein
MVDGTGPMLPRALAHAVARQAEAEWFGSPLHRMALSRPRAEGFSVRPRDWRPRDPEAARQLFGGAFVFAGSALRLGPDGDPFDRPSPSRRFAVALHRFGWMADLAATGEAGLRRALALQQDWRRAFGRWNAFSWSPETLERRVYNLACLAPVMATFAADAEIAALAQDLARQARHLAKITELPSRTLERAAVAAVAGCALAGQAGEKLIAAAMPRLERLLPKVVLADGVHASRSPERGLELLFDLVTLDDALAKRGWPTPEALPRAIDRLTAGVRFLALRDGRLACFQGGETATAARVAAALVRDEGERAVPPSAPHGGYQRLEGRQIQAIVDAGAAARGIYAATACAQPLALEVVCGRDRLITNCGWSPGGGAPQAFRLTDAASTASLADASAGEPLAGVLARMLGPLLIGAPTEVAARRHDAATGAWLELSHDGFAKPYGLRHGRKLFLDRASDELRGEDAFEVIGTGPKRYFPFAVRFHLHPDARASLARDNKSVLIKGSAGVGWWLRNDAPEVSVEPSVHFDGGEARRSSQIVLRGQARPDKGGRIRWKLALAEG